MVLRDQYGIPDAKPVTNKRIMHTIRDPGSGTKFPGGHGATSSLKRLDCAHILVRTKRTFITNVRCN
ncbi:MAG: hypothetical protein U9N12_05600 [Euryarchaeota archaeon]|nr:hypothetical protein [Euryarchaeota archaeon]